MIIDTHAHINFRDFKDDADEVIRRSLDRGVWMINVGSQYGTSKRAVEMAERHQKGVYAAVGLHPIHAKDGFDRQAYKSLLQSSKAVALGEIGLDYYRDYGNFKTEQKEVFWAQLDLVKEMALPAILHCRKAHDDLIEILKGQNIKGVIHCFTGSWQQAKRCLDVGFYLGFNGIIFKMNLDEIIKKSPLDRILLETDCPYLTPPQVEGRNEPIYIKHIAEKIAQTKKISCQSLIEKTNDNARKLFKI